jgi:polysaccharide biosynthesis transport protein
MSELAKQSQTSVLEPTEGLAIPVPRSNTVDRDGLLLILWRRRWTVLACMALALTIAVAYLLLAQPFYTGKARIYVEQTGPQLMGADSHSSASSRDESESYLFTQAEFLRSNPILDPVAARPEIRGMRCLQDVEKPVTFLKKQVDVLIGKKDHILNVSFDAPDPAEAAQLVNAVVASYISYNTGEKRSTARELLEVLLAEKEKRDAELAAKTKKLADYKTANGTLSFDSDQGNVVVQRLAKLSDALGEAELAIVSTRCNYEAAKAVGLSADKMRRLIEAQHMDSGGVAGTGSEAEEREARADMSRMEMQLALVSGKYGGSHPVVRSLRMAVEQRKAQIEQRDKEFCDAYVAAIETTWRTAEQRANEIHAQMDAQQKRALELNAKAAEYTRLESERSRMEKLCDALDARVKELNVTQQGGAFNIHVLEPAQPEDKPSKPAKMATLGMGSVLGLMLGIGLALVQEARDQRLRSADEVQSMLELPLLGVIPHMYGRTTLAQKGQMVHLQPMSAAAEAYRTLRTVVQFGATGGKARSLLFTSPASGDGKSTAASNLAIAMAQAGRKVLLLDADCRRPAQHFIFGLDEGTGFCSLLGDGNAFEQAIRPSGIGNLDILPCGPTPPNPAEVLSSELFLQMLSALQERYDHVVIDSPPANVVTDAQILSAIVDVSILVLRSQSSTRHEARYTRDRLLRVGGRVLGVVVNDVPHRFVSRGYYYSDSTYGGAWPQMRGNRQRQWIAAAEGQVMRRPEGNSL